MQPIVFVAKLSNPASNAVLEKIRDWSASGMISDSLWIDVESPKEIIRVSGNEVKKVKTEQWVMDLDRAISVKMIVVQVHKNDGAAVTVNEARSAFAGTPVLDEALKSSVNLIFPIAETSDASSGYFDQNLNIVVLPVDSSSPRKNVQNIGKTSKQYFGNVAKELAVLAGLWHGMPAAMLPKAQIRLGSKLNVLVVRSFVRYVDASNFVDAIVSSVLDGKNGALPATRVGAGNSALLDEVPNDEAQSEIQRVQHEFTNSHRAALKFKHPNPGSGDAPDDANWLVLFKESIKWMGSWVKRESAGFLGRRITSLQTQIAERIQNKLGHDSSIKVVVGGITVHKNPNGLPLAADSAIGQARVDFGSGERPAPPKPGPLWKEMAEIATSLVDGGMTSNQDVVLPTVSEHGRQVINNPALIAPNPFENSFAIPATLDVPYAGQHIPNNEPLAAKFLKDFLDRRSANSTMSPGEMVAFTKLKQDLNIWLGKQKSLVWAIGDDIAENIVRALTARDNLYESESKFESPNLIAAEAKAQKSLDRMVKGVLTLILGGLGAWLAQALFIFSAFGAWPIIATWWPIALLVAVVTLILWVLGMAIYLVKVLGDLFVLKHKMDLALKALEKKDEEKKLISAEILRLCHYYLQWQVWASLLSNLVHKSQETGTQTTSSTLVGGTLGLPQSMSVARLSAAAGNSAANLLKDVSDKFYQPGWLMDLFRGVIESNVELFTTVAADNLVSASGPLSKADAWVQSGAIHPAMRHVAGSRVEAMATQGQAFSSWMVEHENSFGTVDTQNGTEFLGELSFGENYMPVDIIFTSEAKLSNSPMLSTSLSSTAFDQRMQIGSEFNSNFSISKNLQNSRELDFLGIRLESTDLLNPKDLTIFSAVSTETISETSTVDDSGDIEG